MKAYGGLFKSISGLQFHYTFVFLLPENCLYFSPAFYFTDCFFTLQYLNFSLLWAFWIFFNNRKKWKVLKCTHKPFLCRDLISSVSSVKLTSLVSTFPLGSSTTVLHFTVSNASLCICLFSDVWPFLAQQKKI